MHQRDVKHVGMEAALDDTSSPMCVLVIGMAGSGKTTFTNRFFHHLISLPQPTWPHEEHTDSDSDTEMPLAPLMVNLDPAVLEVPYPTEIDITEVIDYRQVMQEYQLGPNGAIMTCLNLFTASEFDKTVTHIDNRKKSLFKRNAIITKNSGLTDSSEEFSPVSAADFVVFDTPGQIEVFTWSASGTIITETLAALYPTVILYIIDTTLCQNPATFMSNMLYACSILYKTKLPFILVFNKIDETDQLGESGGFHVIESWLRDFETFQEALHSHSTSSSEGEGFHTGYIQSMSLVLEEFYKLLKVVPVSSLSGEGFDQLLVSLDEARTEYFQDYRTYRKDGPDVEQQGLTSLQEIMSNIKITKDQTQEAENNNNT